MRDRTSWAYVELEWRLKVFPSTSNLWVLNFTAPRYTLLFLNSKIYIVHVINYEWSRSVNFPLRIFCMRYKPCFSHNWYQSSLKFRICITCFVSFGIKDSNFMMLDDSTINFLHGCWNYCLIKTEIDVMMLFKFDIKYVKLNFKAITSIKFSFDLNLILMWSRNYVLFKWNVKKVLPEKFEKIQFHEFRSIENHLRSIECSFSIDRMVIESTLRLCDEFLQFFDWSRIPFDLLNVPFRSIE